jgi:hypothetical protein
MLWALVIVMFVFWVLGLAAGSTGGLITYLLFVSLVIVAVKHGLPRRPTPGSAKSKCD